MPALNLPLIPSHRPRSFIERGVAAPFTTPMLCGARFRRTQDAAALDTERALIVPARDRPTPPERMRTHPLEVIVRNPSGGRGVYILPWIEIGALCRPTMHDIVLGQAVSATSAHPASSLAPSDAEPSLTPAVLRDIGRQVAAQGLAGRDAARAATEAMQSHRTRLAATRLTLLFDLIVQTEPTNTGQPPLSQEAPEGIERRGAAALAHIAARLGLTPEHATALLDRLAADYADIGLGVAQSEAPITWLLAAIGALRRDLIDWAERDAAGPAMEASGRATRIAAAAELVGRMAQVPLTEARLRAHNMPELLREAAGAPAALSERFARTAWLLDGWEQIVLTWHAAAATRTRSEALQDIAFQLPVLPDEAELWLGLPPGTATQLHDRTLPRGPRNTSDSLAMDQTARREVLRAMAG